MIKLTMQHSATNSAKKFLFIFFIFPFLNFIGGAMQLMRGFFKTNHFINLIASSTHTGNKITPTNKALLTTAQWFPFFIRFKLFTLGFSYMLVIR